ncbi:glycogenin 1 isoform X2 [Andrena cerasifolii]
MREKLSAVFSVVMEVNVLDSKDEANLALLARPELGITFTKLHCWRLTQYEKCVFLDADTLVVRNCDELFEREELSAAPDVGWPDCFNSGVFVYKPCQQTFASITSFAAAKGSFDGGDQGLLNMYFSDWARKDISKHLPFIYNMCSTATYSYLPAFKQFGEDVRIIHFIGITKPWLQYFDTLTGIVQPPMGSAHLQPLLQLWWNIFCEKVHPHLSPVMATSTLAPIWHEFSPMPYQSPAPKPPVYTDIQDNTQSDIYSETPDFSEFKDPWENYCIQNDPVINKKEDNNETEQYYSTIDRSSPITVLRNEFNSVKLAQQAHYESPLEHNRESFQQQQYNEYRAPAVQSNKFVNENKQQNSFFHSENTPSTIGHSNYWGNQHITESYVHSAQNHHSSESQHQHQHVNHQHSCNDSNASLSEGTKQHQHVEHRPAYQHSSNDSHKSLPEQVREHQHVEYQYIYQDSSNNNNDKPWSEQAKQHQHGEPHADYQHNQHHVHDYQHNQHHVPDYQHNQHHVHDYQHNQHHVPDYQHNQHHVHDYQHNQHHVHDYQHNQHHAHDYQHNQQHVHDDVNKQQPPQHHEQENHIVHSNEQTNFVYRNHESLNDKFRHEQAAETAVAHQNDYSIKESGERGENINITDERTHTQISTSPHPVSKPCTDTHNVATQSDPHVTEDSSNAGLAGALAQMTLGEPRSAAQVALEEHMRKQSWEQGQIDYMGRDSFDNIWKKICETLALAPPRLPSPPKETEKPAKTATDETAEPTESIESAEPTQVTQPIEAADEVDKGTAQATTSHTEEQSLVNNVPITNNDNIISKLSEKGKQVVDITSAETNENKQPVSEGVTEDITQESSTKPETTESLDTIVDPSPAQPSMQTSPEKIIEELNTSSLLQEASQETAEIVVEELCAGSLLVEAAQETIEKVVEELSAGSLLKEALQETTPPRVPADPAQSCSIEQHRDESPCSKDSAIFAAPTEQLASNVTDIIDLQIAVDVEQPKSSDIKDEKHAKELLTASEVLTISPVPIQVAESVLQIEPKESVSDSQTVTEEVLSSTITPVHESEVPCSEILVDAGNKIQVNGSASGVVSAESEGKSSRATIEAVESIDAVTILSESSMPSTETSQALPPTEAPLLTETSALPSSITKSTETSEARVDKTSQQTTELDQQTKETASCTKETKETEETKESTKPPSECVVAEASPSSESPVRPSRAKELNVPSTSAPETPTQESKDQEKVTKKAARKSIDKSASEGEPGETTEGDSTGKKAVKKVVKKVTKKPKSKPEEALDDGAQDSNSANKPKKTVKVTKKGTKSLQTPDAPDAAVSETPSSSTSDTPVPPKRKSKAPPTKPAVKKPDVE